MASLINTYQIGNDITADIYDNGETILTGTGATYDYTMGESPFSENANVVNTLIGEGITVLGNNLFRDANNMVTCDFPSTLWHIKDFCFSGCSNLEKAITSVTDLERFCFDSCSSLTEVEFNPDITVLPYAGFQVSGLISVTIPDKVSSIGSYCFYGCSDLAKIINYYDAEQNIKFYCFPSAPEGGTAYASANNTSFITEMNNKGYIVKDISEAPGEPGQHEDNILISMHASVQAESMLGLATPVLSASQGVGFIRLEWE